MSGAPTNGAGRRPSAPRQASAGGGHGGKARPGAAARGDGVATVAPSGAGYGSSLRLAP